MWLNPKYRDRAEPSGPPAETGQRLATFARDQGTELRVTLAQYQGHDYISLRVWERDRGGRWWPTKRGCSVRMGELPGLVEALGGIGTDLGLNQPEVQGSHRTLKGRGDRPRKRAGPDRLPSRDGGSFDEFDEG